jgi:hypothetical protein
MSLRDTLVGTVVGLVLGVLVGLLIHYVQPPVCHGTQAHCAPALPGFITLLVGVGLISAGIGACAGAAWHWHHRTG